MGERQAHHTMSQPLVRKDGAKIAMIGDEDTLTGFLLTGIGDIPKKGDPNFLQCDGETPVEEIEAIFHRLTKDPDIGVIIINQWIATKIQAAIKDYNKVIPTVVTIPSKDLPYDSESDPVFQRVKRLMGMKRQ